MPPKVQVGDEPDKLDSVPEGPAPVAPPRATSTEPGDNQSTGDDENQE